MITRNEDCGRLATITPLTGYEPNVFDNFDDTEGTTSIFQSSSDLGDNSTEKSLDQEIDDEHIRKALASPLYIQERETNANLWQTYHSNEESLLPDAQSILTSMGKPVAEGGNQSPDTVPTPRFLRRPSARESFNPMEGIFPNNYGPTNKDFKSRNFTLTNSLLQHLSLVGK